MFAIILIGITSVVPQVVAQWNCGGTSYTPGSIKFTKECHDAVENCISQFAANASQVNCQGAAGNLYMQQQASGGSNSDYTSAFEDILDFCLLDGWTTGTWDDGSDGQWFWMAAESGCYSQDGTIGTSGPGFCIQDRTDTVVDGCYPQPAPNSGPLQVLRTAKTANGFTSSGRGWNSWGIEALSDPTIIPGWTGANQQSVLDQCTVLSRPEFRNMGYDLCSLDAGWNTNDVDDYGRIQYNNTEFNLPQLAQELHAKGLKLGVYVIPGVPCGAANRTIKGTNILIGDVLNGNNDGLDYCDWDFSKDGVQQWHDSLLELWTSWGIDMIKLDFLTPGSPSNGANLPCNNSAAVEAYHKAIANSGQQVRLDLSWKLCRNETYLPLWSSFAESMRTDQDIDNYGTNTFLAWQVVQRAIENYRQYISLQKERNVPITIYPDMDNLFVCNPQNLTGVSDTERVTIMNHWLGAGANLVLGCDLRHIDALGTKLLTSSQSVSFANFAAKYPMQPRNPGTGNNLAQQVQAWIGGPDETSNAYVLLVNYGPDQGSGGFNTSLSGVQEVTISLNDLGISGKQWKFTDVWNSNSSRVSSSFTAYLGEGESQLLYLEGR
ncbi:Alpha-galactosidase [Penicillium lagena]|uniref:Alpha-galactosidase n=1 Tax=Penicillium lagena TaxID=94218 RepID=UPI002541F627|nr:Alpha-galactosidase [Penicillium lagena]KAJ5610292.1 Alpha-galactosidase [Penicillium lagena]